MTRIYLSNSCLGQFVNALSDHEVFELVKEATQSEGGFSLDLEPADKEPKNQNWLL